MTRLLLDTDTLSFARRMAKRPRPFQTFMQTIDLTDTFVAAISIAEIAFGSRREERHDPVFAAELTRWLHERVRSRYAGRILPFDEDAAIICGTLKTPRMKPTMDAMIAAIAMSRDLTIVTHNVADYEPFGVAIIDPLA